MVYLHYEDQRGEFIILNNKFSRKKLQRKLRGKVPKKRISQILSEGYILPKGEGIQIKVHGIGRIMTEEEKVVTFLQNGEKLIIYYDTSFERIHSSRNIVLDWILETKGNLKNFFCS